MFYLLYQRYVIVLNSIKMSEITLNKLKPTYVYVCAFEWLNNLRIILVVAHRCVTAEIFHVVRSSEIL